MPIEATAYSSDWRSCGWEWGLALGPLPLYLPLCAGVRPSVHAPFGLPEIISAPSRNSDIYELER